MEKRNFSVYFTTVFTGIMPSLTNQLLDVNVLSKSNIYMQCFILSMVIDLFINTFYSAFIELKHLLVLVFVDVCIKKQAIYTSLTWDKEG